MTHEHNCLNINFILSLLEDINIAFKSRRDIHQDINLDKWGVHDDYIYCEYLQHHLVDALPCERRAMMRIVREIINASAEAYDEFIKDGYYTYEDYNNDNYSLDELTEQLELNLSPDKKS